MTDVLNVIAPSQVTQFFAIRAKNKYQFLNTNREIKAVLWLLDIKVIQNNKQKQVNSNKTSNKNAFGMFLFRHI